MVGCIGWYDGRCKCSQWVQSAVGFSGVQREVRCGGGQWAVGVVGASWRWGAIGVGIVGCSWRRVVSGLTGWWRRQRQRHRNGGVVLLAEQQWEAMYVVNSEWAVLAGIWGRRER